MSCQLCKHWTPTEDNRAPQGFGVCESLTQFGGYNLWRDVPVERQPSPADIVVETDEGWGLFTGPEFYCSHFEEKA